MDSVDLSIALAISGGFGKYQTRLILMMIPITTSGVFCASSITFILPAIVCEMQISKYKQGFLFSAVYIGMVVGGFLWGMIGDVIGRKKVLVILLGLTALMEIISAFTLTYWSLFMVKVISGFMNSGIMTTCVTYTTEFIDGRNRDRMTMRVGCVTTLGYFIQPIIAVFLLPLKFKYFLYGDLVYLNSWKMFILAGSLPAVSGFFVALFALYESPAFLLRRSRQEEAMAIVRYIYSTNTGKPPESFPAKKLYLKEDEERLNEEKKLVAETGKEIGWKEEVSGEIKPLFHFPFLVPTLLVFLNQFVTMAAFNAVRSHQTTMIAMSLGIGQDESVSSNITELESLPFCTLFQTQNIFKKSIKCSQDTVMSNYSNCGILTTFFTYASEFIDGKNRDKMTMRIGCATALGYFIQPMLAVFTLPYPMNFSILNDLIILNEWKLFILAGTLFPFAGFLVAVFILYESPAFLLRTGHDQKAMEIVRRIYTTNTGNPPETFPAKTLYLKEDEEKIEQEKQLLQRGGKISWMDKVSTEIKPLFHYPYLIPALMISLNPKLYYCSAVIGFCIFISFIPAGEAVRKFGKKCVFLAAHLICAVCISIIPWSGAIFTLFLMCIFSVCLQNCVAISIGLMLGRVPTSMRGITISLIMTCGRFGVIVGSQILPVLTNISCPVGFVSVAFINLLAVPIIIIFSRQPNPLKEEGIKLLKELETTQKS
ncbi:hypothetical protein V9T40_014544 [Parthenolecanium corni]|uniref:Major facilitator superfamily (MFS) profile domain-containing protein n=1 Tax=Parthenolecanium corni TaxID=536013 RepID=A0AAN9THW8_9HEMI